MEQSGVVDEPNMVISGTWDGTAREFKDIYVRYIVYIKGGRLYKVSALKRENFNKYQISSESGLSNLCESHIHYDFKNIENSRFVYRLKGLDNTCDTGDDVRKMIRIDMGAGDTPLVIPSGMSIVKELINRTDGSIIGWLTHNSSTLKLNRCDADIDNCYELPPNANVQRAKHLGSDWSSTKEALWYYNGTETWICIYDFSNDTMAIPYGLLGNQIYDHEKDSQAVYISFSAGGIGGMAKINFDGTATYLVSGDIREFALTDDRVVFITSGGGNQILRYVKKDGTDMKDLVTNRSFFPLLVTKGNKVFYSAHDSSRFYAGSVNDDGTDLYEKQDSLWSFFLFDLKVTNNDSKFPAIYRVVRTDGCDYANETCANGTLKSFDAATYSSTQTGINIGQVPADMYVLGTELPFGAGKNVIGIGFGGQTDVFYFRADEADSLKRITNTPSVDEYPIFIH